MITYDQAIWGGVFVCRDCNAGRSDVNKTKEKEGDDRLRNDSWAGTCTQRIASFSRAYFESQSRYRANRANDRTSVTTMIPGMYI